ncbi:unnamed protein product [Caenorhabditis brenneri]
MPATFPLLRLPIDERLAVLRQMEMNHLFILSLASKRAKNLVTSSNRKARGVLVSVYRKIQFSCYVRDTGIELLLSIWKTPKEPRKVKKPKHVTIYQSFRKTKPIKCTKEEYKPTDWLEHLCQIFHQKDYELIFERHGSRYDFDSVYENFKNPGRLDLSGTGNTDYDNRALNMIIPRHEISLYFGIFENGRPPKHILIRNYDFFDCYGNSQLLSWSRPLDDLLCANSRKIRTSVSGFTEKDINKFLKLWICGSNPRLEKLLIFNAPVNYDNVLRGIQNWVVSEDQENVFESYSMLGMIDLKGSREIRRMDGTVAGVFIDNVEFIFNFFVLHDC